MAATCLQKLSGNDGLPNQCAHYEWHTFERARYEELSSDILRLFVYMSARPLSSHHDAVDKIPLRPYSANLRPM